MNINTVGNLRNAFIASIITAAAGCTTVHSPAYSNSHRPTPREIGDRANDLLKQLAEFGRYIDTERLSDGTLRVTLTCDPGQCGGTVQPNFVFHPPVPPPPLLEIRNIEKSITLFNALGQLNAPAVNFGQTTVIIEGTAGTR